MRKLGEPWDHAMDIGLVMSNWDHSIQEGLKAELRAGRWGHHAGWYFNGHVWFEEDAFHEEVWQHQQPVTIIVAPSLKELMKVVNGRFGWD